MELLDTLIDRVARKQVILFLGAGAAIGAEHPDGSSPPTGKKLRDMLNEHFLAGNYGDLPLDQVAELAISESSSLEVQKFVREIFIKFKPADFHVKMTRLPWVAIATTNYDLLIERAYSQADANIQNLVPFIENNDRVDEKMSRPDSVMYLKLHGCITKINNPDAPLILSPDQFANYRKNRRRLFRRLEDKAFEYPILFVGHNLSDPSLRNVLNYLDNQLGSAKPRSYLLRPNFRPAEENLWQSKKITPIEGTFNNLITALDEGISSEFRILAGRLKEDDDFPIERRFKGGDGDPPSNNLKTFLKKIEFIHKDKTVEYTEPQAFYKGFFEDWGPIEQNLDAQREIEEDIKIEVLLSDEHERPSDQELYILKGHAGAGKSVILKRLAWDAALDFGLLSLYKSSFETVDFKPLQELYSRCKERIFLFVDRAKENMGFIDKTISFCVNSGIKITIISTERHNVWNESCDELDPLVDNFYSVDYLSPSEIKELLILLERHDCLGHLEGETRENQIKAFKDRAGRQLLVALHEATLGKPFEEIVQDEYESIEPEQARLLYLTVSVLYRLNVKVRAGVISRIHQIPFRDFKDRLYSPLEYIVFDEADSATGTPYYKCRHSYIAQVLFERVLTKPTDRFEYYRQVFSSLDIGYKADREAFRGMVKANHLLDLFPDHNMINELFEIGLEISDGDASLLQQRAIFEMREGNLEDAGAYLQEAREERSWDNTIRHSLAELQLRRARESSTDIEREKHLRSAKNNANSLLNDARDTSYAYHTLLKIGLLEIEEAIKSGDQIYISQKMTNFERTRLEAIGQHPDSPFIHDAEAQYRELIDDEPAALEHLERAHENDKRSSYISLRLAESYVSKERPGDAVDVLKETLGHSPDEQDVHFKLARLLQKEGGDQDEIMYHLRRSFTSGDSRYEPQFWYARQLFISGRPEDANDVFNYLERADVKTWRKQKPRGVVKENDDIKAYRGSIVEVKPTFAFISVDVLNDDIFSHRKHDHSVDLVSLTANERVMFNIAFTYRGPVAVGVKRE